MAQPRSPRRSSSRTLSPHTSSDSLPAASSLPSSLDASPVGSLSHLGGNPGFESVFANSTSPSSLSNTRIPAPLAARASFFTLTSGLTEALREHRLFGTRIVPTTLSGPGTDPAFPSFSIPTFNFASIHNDVTSPSQSPRAASMPRSERSDSTSDTTPGSASAEPSPAPSPTSRPKRSSSVSSSPGSTPRDSRTPTCAAGTPGMGFVHGKPHMGIGLLKRAGCMTQEVHQIPGELKGMGLGSLQNNLDELLKLACGKIKIHMPLAPAAVYPEVFVYCEFNALYSSRDICSIVFVMRKVAAAYPGSTIRLAGTEGSGSDGASLFTISKEEQALGLFHITASQAKKLYGKTLPEIEELIVRLSDERIENWEKKEEAGKTGKPPELERAHSTPTISEAKTMASPCSPATPYGQAATSPGSPATPYGDVPVATHLPPPAAVVPRLNRTQSAPVMHNLIPPLSPLSPLSVNTTNLGGSSLSMLSSLSGGSSAGPTPTPGSLSGGSSTGSTPGSLAIVSPASARSLPDDGVRPALFSPGDKTPLSRAFSFTVSAIAVNAASPAKAPAANAASPAKKAPAAKAGSPAKTAQTPGHAWQPRIFTIAEHPTPAGQGSTSTPSVPAVRGSFT